MTVASQGGTQPPPAGKSRDESSTATQQQQQPTATTTTENTTSVANDVDASPPTPMASLSELFSFARTVQSRTCLVGALLAAGVSGAILPTTAYFYAAVSGELSGNANTASGGDDALFLQSVREQCFLILMLGAILFGSMTLQATLADAAANEMARTLQQEWFRALLRQDMAYFDIVPATGEGSIIAAKAKIYHKGVGTQLALGVQFLVTFLGGLGYAFYASWQVALAILAVIPLIAVTGTLVGKLSNSVSTRTTASYTKAASIVTSSVSSIRTVLSLNAVEITTESFQVATKEAYDGAVGQVGWLGLAVGGIMGNMLFCFFIVTLLGSFLIYDQVKDTGGDPSGTAPGNDQCDPGGLDIFGALLGILFMSTVAPHAGTFIESLTNARVACYPALVVINRVQLDNDANKNNTVAQDRNDQMKMRRGGTLLPAYIIDSSSTTGLQPNHVAGTFEFNNVMFSYPTRQEVGVLHNFSLKIEAGKTVALVGASGSGKSTVVQLLERFYDPLSGSITLDGVGLRDLNIKWLRNTIALVQQEPKLFESTIRANIAMGAPAATDEDIETASKSANAHNFIMGFPKGYDTDVGALGYQLSGGQRQRICNARCLVETPKILLLDESTSALDSESEATVQKSLDELIRTTKMTTLVIAHRLSTIRNADVIAVVDGGSIVETGTHSELLAKQSHYFRLVEAQQVKSVNQRAEVPQKSTNDLHSVDLLHPKDNMRIFAEIDESRPIMLEFDDVCFEYPNRPDSQVFNGLNLKVRQGETLALVGPSGSGKSTAIQLLECFYRPTSGKLKYKGVDALEMNVKWLREQLGLVSQQPILFDCSIEDNIRYGLPGASHEQVVEVAKQANAHKFIMDFPEGYGTSVGQGSTLISGEAENMYSSCTFKNPPVLLLDEATSALDSENERIVQAALDDIMSNPDRTCVVIAHRLSTLATASRIAVIEQGKVTELGTHDELMTIPDGRYKLYQSLQNLGDDIESKIANELKSSTVNNGIPSPHVIEDSGKISNNPDEKENLVVDRADVRTNSKRARVLASSDSWYFIVGGIGALLTGLVFPAWGVLFALMIEVFYTSVSSCPPLPNGANFTECDEYWIFNANSIQSQSFIVSYGYLGIIGSALIGFNMLYWGFGVATERMNKRVRDAVFGSLLRQEVAWYDVRSVGSIVSRVSDDAALLHAYSGEPIRTLVSALSSVLVGVMVSFYFMWPFALVTLCILPVMAAAGELEQQMYREAMGTENNNDSNNKNNELDFNSPGGIVMESLSNIRTVASLALEDDRMTAYNNAIEKENPHATRNSFSKGLTAGVGQLVQMWAIALMFWWGGWLLHRFSGNNDKDGIVFTFRDFLIAMFSIFFSLSGLSTAFEGAVDRTKAHAAAAHIFELTDRTSLIDPLSEQGKTNV